MSVPNRWNLPDLGLGVGLRSKHFQHIAEEAPPVDWFEIISENFLRTEGRPLWYLDQIAERYPIVMHGVSMGIGGTDPVDFDYLRQLKALADRVNAVWMGDHVCWTGVLGRTNHDLLPVAYDEETLDHMVERVRVAQDVLERPLVLENPSTYMTFAQSTMAEHEFIAQLAERSDCALLLDVNNVYVSAKNHGWSASDYLDGIPYERVVQIHLAGHTDKGEYCIDTHDGPVIEPVWELYAEVMRRAGNRATLLEWDDHFPETFEEIHAEVLLAQRFREGVGASS